MRPTFTLEVPGIFFCPVLSRLKRFGVDLIKYVDPRPARAFKIIAFPEAKIISDIKNMKIGTLNVMTLKNDYPIDILTDEFRRFELNLLGASEIYTPGVGK